MKTDLTLRVLLFLGVVGLCAVMVNEVFARETAFGAERQAKDLNPAPKQYFNSSREEELPPEEAIGVEDPLPPVREADVEPPVVQGLDQGKQRTKDQIGETAMHHAKLVAQHCPGAWEKYSCLKIVSETYLSAAALYAEDLEQAGQKAEQEPLKEHCAASTAATQLDDVPAYAMRSAFAECTNEMYAIYERSGVMMDQELGQLQVMAVLCLDKDPRCRAMEQGLKQTMGQ